MGGALLAIVLSRWRLPCHWLSLHPEVSLQSFLLSFSPSLSLFRLLVCFHCQGKTTPLLSSPSKSEWVGVYLTLAQAHSKLNHTPEAVKIMQDAVNRFAGTPEEARYMNI